MLAVEKRPIPVQSGLGGGPVQPECGRRRGPSPHGHGVTARWGAESWGWNIGAKPDQLGHPSGAHRLLLRDSGCGVEPTALRSLAANLHSRACRALQRNPCRLGLPSLVSGQMEPYRRWP